MEKILVIGGSGFLGSHVVHQLLSCGYAVKNFDLVRSNNDSNLYEYVKGDIMDDQALIDAAKGTSVVFNFAGVSDLEEAQNQPKQSILDNILGNLHALEASKKAGVKRYVYASTVYVYSLSGGFYRCSKQAAESYIYEYARVHGLPYTILRFGSLYGPGGNSKNGLWRVVERAILTGQVTYEGSPDSMRGYIHVYDAAQASIDIMAEKFKNHEVIITGHELMHVVDVLHIIAEILGLPSSAVKFTDSLRGGHYVRTPFSHETKVAKKYSPDAYVDLGQGLLSLIQDVKRGLGD